MNCKKGDIARVIVSGSFCGFIVRCLEPTVDRFTGIHGWIVEPNVGGYRGITDRVLRPIRDTDGTDEILALIGKPVGDEVAA